MRMSTAAEIFTIVPEISNTAILVICAKIGIIFPIGSRKYFGIFLLFHLETNDIGGVTTNLFTIEQSSVALVHGTFFLLTRNYSLI